MKNIVKYITLALLGIVYFSCEEDPIVFDVDGNKTALSLNRTSANIGVCEPSTSIYVESTTRSEIDRTVNLQLNASSTADPSEYSLSTTSVVIPAGEFVSNPVVIEVDFNEVPEGASRSLILDMVLPEGSTLNSRGSFTASYESVCILNEIAIDLKFDQFPEEAAWILRDSEDNIIDASFDENGQVDFGVYADQSSFSKILCLPDGAYSITFFDSYGDGNTGNANGSYGVLSLSCSGSSNIFERVRSGEFGASGSVLGTDPVTINFSLGD